MIMMIQDQQNRYSNCEITAYLKQEHDLLQKYEGHHIYDKNPDKLKKFQYSQDTWIQRERQKSMGGKVCSVHNKRMQYICCTCQELKCVQCTCEVKITGYSNWIDYYGSRHTFIKVSKYFDRRKEQLKSMVNIKLNECCMRIQQERVNKQIEKIHKYLIEVSAISSNIKELVQEIMSRFSQNLSEKKVSLKSQSKRRYQEKQAQINDEKVVENILRIREREDEQVFQEILLENWPCVNRAIKKIKQKKNQGLMKNKYSNQRSVIQGKNEISTFMAEFQSLFMSKLKKVETQLEGVRALIFQQSQLQNYKRKTNDKSRCTQYSVSPSLYKRSIQIYENENRKNRSKVKKTDARMQSITNALNKQINGSKALRNHKTTQITKICPQQHKLIYIYGGKQTKNVIQTYNPWRSSQQNKQNFIQRSHEDVYKPTHTGFGLIKIVNQQKYKQNKPHKTSSVILVGGYMNNEITDCIFRINGNCNKRQLIGRLDAPLASFGFYPDKKTQDKQKKFNSMYICGGYDNYKPVSSFISLQFSSDGSLLNKIVFPSLDRPLHSLTLTKHHQNLYAIGGIDEQNIVVKTVTKFSLQELTWKHISNLCYERSNHATISLRSGLYVIGGWNGQNYLRSVQRFDQGREIFSVIMDMKEARSNFGAIPFIENNAILILGGKNTEQLGTCEYLSIKEKTAKQALKLSFQNSYIYSFL